MKLFIFNNVLCDYTSGMVVVIAENLRDAQMLCQEEFYGRSGDSADLETWLKSSDNFGFNEPTSTIVVSESEQHRIGIVSYVYGGS